jgi:hypothetical protein
MKPKLSLVAILSISAIAGGIALGSVSSAEACYRSKSYYKQQRYEQANWLKSPISSSRYITWNRYSSGSISRESLLQQRLDENCFIRREKVNTSFGIT